MLRIGLGAEPVVVIDGGHSEYHDVRVPAHDVLVPAPDEMALPPGSRTCACLIQKGFGEDQWDDA